MSIAILHRELVVTIREREIYHPIFLLIVHPTSLLLLQLEDTVVELISQLLILTTPLYLLKLPPLLNTNLPQLSLQISTLRISTRQISTIVHLLLLIRYCIESFYLMIYFD